MKKKMLGLVGIGCSFLLLVGCGNTEANKENGDNKDNNNTVEEKQKLSCSMDLSDAMSGLGTMEMELVVDYNAAGTEPQELTLVQKIEMTSSEVTEDIINSLATNLEGETCTDEFKSCNVVVDGRKITLTAVGSPSTVTGDDEAENSKSYDAAKKYFEDMGYTCK